MCKYLNKGRTTLWCWVRDGHFPQPIRVGNKTLGWTTKQYQSWLERKESESQ
ncbi:MAG: helix-turn-helix transcriptional regulator [Vibrio sp.]